MGLFFIASYAVLWVLVLFLGFLLLGTLRTMGLLQWRLEELRLTTPRRLGRDGLKPGRKAPDFTLPSVTGSQVSLSEYRGKKVFLIFTQTGCGPCTGIVGKLERIIGAVAQIVIVNNGDLEATRKWAEDLKLRVPVLVQENYAVSRKYEVLATPFAFLINEQGIVVSKGITANARHVGFVLKGDRSESADEEHATGEAEFSPDRHEKADEALDRAMSSAGGQ